MKVRISHHLIGTLVIAVVAACSHNDDATTVADATTTEAVEAVSAQTQPGEASAATTNAGAAPSETPTPMPAGAPAETATGMPAVSNEPEQAQLAEQSESGLEPPAPASDGPTALNGAKAQAVQNIAGQAIASNAPGNKAATAVAAHVGQLSPQAAARDRFNRAATKLASPPREWQSEVMVPYSMYSMKSGNAGISNTDPSARVYFATRPQSGDWENQYLDPQAMQEFLCGLQECLFAIRTGNNPILKYKLRPNERYAIKWNGSKGLWDLRWTPTK